jgi:DNA-directed RNA polymerase subunit RPC12/RpoP
MSEIIAYGAPDADWVCAACDRPLAPAPATLTYLGSDFAVTLMRCPDCGLTLISEELALGKMLRVEKLLEDK